MASVAVVASNDALIELSTDGVKWMELPFVGSVSATGAEAPETEINAFRGSGKISGRERVASLALTVVSYVPAQRAWREVTKASKAGSRLNWQITTKETIVVEDAANTMIAVSTAGKVAVTGSKASEVDLDSDRFSLGMALQVGNKLYSVDYQYDPTDPKFLGTDASAGDMYVSDPSRDEQTNPIASAIAATNKYKFVIPAFRLGPFLAAPSGRGNFEMATEAALTANVTLTPAAQPEWSMQVVKNNTA